MGGNDTVYGEFVVVPDVLPGLPARGPLGNLSDRVSARPATTC